MLSKRPSIHATDAYMVIPSGEKRALLLIELIIPLCVSGRVFIQPPREKDDIIEETVLISVTVFLYYLGLLGFRIIEKDK